jgi:ATP-dependent Clp protease protease subunit
MDPRIIVIGGEINPETVTEFLKEFSELDASSGPIEVRICSDGGWCEGGFAIFDAIQTAANDVTTIGLGSVGSIAVLIFNAGHKRVLAPNAVLFLHETSSHFEASLSQLNMLTKEINRLHSQYCQRLSERTGWELKEVEKACAKEMYLPAEAALTLGFADAILTRPPKPAKRKNRK